MRRIVILLLAAVAPAPAAHAANVTMVARGVPLTARTVQSASAPVRFNMLGLHWQGSGSVEYRVKSPAGRWAAWQIADADTGPDAGSAESRR